VPRAIALIVLLAAVAHAENRQLARDFYKEGSRLYDVTDYRGALEAFKKAYVNYEEPTLLFNIAQCHRYLGEKTEALTFYKTYLRKSPNAPNAEDVRGLIKELESALEGERRAKNAPPAGTLGPGPAKSASAKAPDKNKKAEAQKPAEKPAEKPSENAAVAQVPAAVDTGPATPAPASQQDQPLIKKWWLWTAVGGGVVVIALAVGLGVGLSQGDSPYPATNTAMVFRF
jgi:tetratricopeptide (TPR) repeat protein